MNCRSSVARATLSSLSLSLLSSSLAHAQTKPQHLVPAEPRPQARAIVRQLLSEGKIIRATDVHRGMRGVARSVFQGTKIEEFPIEILGTLSRVQGGGDVILIKVLGGPVVERNSGIIAGMSGSPVYINGKMLGAIALGWGFPKEPIGGVTPITQMIESSLPDVTPRKAKAPAPNGTTSTAPVTGKPNAPTSTPNAPAAAPTPTTAVFKPKGRLHVAGHDIARVVVSRDPHRLALSEGPHGATMTLRPCTTMLQLSGFSESSLPYLRKIFAPYGVEPVLVPSGGALGLSGLQRLQAMQPPPSPGPLIGPSSVKRGVSAPPFVPGSALGVQLVSGDMDQTAVGTVTFRWGNRILAFGHPMFGQGAASMPMASAYVHEIFPAYDRSFKLASPIAGVGAIQQDTDFAIGGTVGSQADTIPMSVSLRDPSRGIARTFHVHVMKDPVLTPQLINAVAGEAIQSTLGLASDKMVRIRMRMEIANAPTIVRRNLVYSSDVIQQMALADLGQTLAITQGNDFAKANIRRVSLDVQVEQGRKVEIVKSLTANRNRLKAGDTVQVKVVLESVITPGQTETHTFTFHVPADAPDGVLRIAAGSAADYWPLQVRVGGTPPDPSNLPELVQAWQRVGPMNDLLVTASTPRTLIKVDRTTIPNPSPAFSALIGQSRSSSVSKFNEVEMQQIATTSMLAGSQVLSIPVEGINHEKDGGVTTPPAATDTDTTTPDTSDTSAVPSATTAPATPDDPGDGSDGDNSTGGRGSAAPLPQAYASRDSFWDGHTPAAFLMQINALQRATRMGARIDHPVTPTVLNATPTPVGTPTPTPTPTIAALDATKLGRPAKSWVQSGAADFLSGDFDRAIVTNAGDIRVSPSNTLLATTADPFAWSVAGDKSGNVYIGMGNIARVLRIAPNGAVTTLYENTNEIGVTSLACDDAGNVYAGVTPGAKVYRITPTGAKTLILNPGQSFAWALKFDAQGRLLVGTGGTQGRVYRLDNVATLLSVPPTSALQNVSTGATPGGAPAPLVSVKSKQVHAIALRGDEMFLGTGDDGILYRVDAQNKVTALYQATTADGKPAPNAEILAIAAAPEGIYFGTSSSGTLYRYSPEHGVEVLYPSPQKAVYAMQRGADGTIYVGTGDSGVVYTVTPGEDANSTRAARLLEPTQNQTLALNLTPGGDLLVATGNNAAAYRITLGDHASGTFTSGVFDAGNVVQWGSLRLVARGATLETRSGNTREPDASWSDFQSAQNTAGELHVASPAARYLQYRARLDGGGTTSGDANAPQISRVEVVYRARNTPPQVAISTPKGGEFVNGQKKFTWAGKDDDSDPLRYKAYLSADDGATWQPVTLDDATSTTLTLDTTKQKDGVYRLKVEASDAARNPDDPRVDSATSLPFTIDNTPPQIDAGSLQISTTPEGTRVQVSVSDALSPIVGVGVRAVTISSTRPLVKTGQSAAGAASPGAASPGAASPGAASPGATPATTPATTTPAAAAADPDFATAAAQDGIFDSKRETAVATLPDANIIKVVVRVQDAAGNTTTVTLPAGG